MRFKFLIFLLSATLFGSAVVAQTGTGGAGAAPAPLNQKDARGKAHGTWYVQQPARMGEPAFIEFGNYDHGRKAGIWYKLDGEGQLIAMERYRDDVLDGEVKYFENGYLTCVGHYRGLNPRQKFDTIIVADPITGLEKLVSVSTDRGALRHGTWRYYDPQTGRLIKEEEYQVDDLIGEKTFGLTKEDSTYYQKRVRTLPHVKNGNQRTKRAQNSNIGY